MGDHRATIKIKFEMHGVTTKQELWINWWYGAWNDLPTAVVNVFKEAEWASLDAFYKEQDDADTKRQANRLSLVESARAKLTPEEWAAIRL